MRTASRGLIALLLAFSPAIHADALTDLFDEYRVQGAGPFDAARGGELWLREYQTDGATRSCTTCHSRDPSATGEHQRTGKPIEPLAPRVNPQRLSDQGDMRKWLLRNCKWTLGRECTPQERGDLLTYIRSY